MKNDDFIIDQNYTFNSRKFTNLKEIIDTSFKLDFIPYKKYLFTRDIIERYTIELEQEIKQKYYINFVYKSLLNFEIDGFISRQPSYSLLSEFEETDLFQKRKALSNYYESNYYYSQINHFDKFREFFFNSKSFINNTYNQQFKGTLRIVERLFHITLDNNDRSVLKYDNSLFYNNETDIFHHEELMASGIKTSPNYKALNITNSSPLFIGWNTDLHQLVITNNLVVKKLPVKTTIFSPFTIKDDKFIFTPITIGNIQKINNLLRNSYSILQTPSLKSLFSSMSLNKICKLPVKIDDIYYLDLLDTNEFYLRKLSVLSKPNQNSLLATDILNWYSFRYTFPKK